MRRSTILITATLVVTAVGLAAPSAWAIPAFARKHNLACSSCHSAMPYLNATGRAFKEAGWMLPDEDGEIDFDAQPGNQKISESLIFDKIYPISGRMKGYIIDDQEGSETKIRPIHEFEVLSAGNFSKKGSWMFEFESEDEEEFGTAMAGSFGWHQSPQVNFELGFGSILHTDPYNSLKDGGHRLTVAHKTALDVGKSVDARFRKDAQFINFYGRKNKVFYMLGYSGGNSNPEGEDPKDLLGRVAFDISPNVMIGAFYFDGQREGGDIDLNRVGVDWNLDFDNLHVLGMWMSADETFAGGPNNDNAAGYLELFYTRKKDGRPFFVPLVRYDFTELNNGMDDFASITAQAGFYVKENFKLAFEYQIQTDQPADVDKLNRVTLLADLAF